MHNNNNYKNRDHFKKNQLKKKKTKMIKLYICKNIKIKITLRYF